MSNTLLTSIGLSEKESLLYELLLKMGEKSVTQLAKQAGVKRATAYHILYELEKKGLVKKRDIGKKIHFQLEPPDKLLQVADTKLKDYERARKELSDFIPDLTASYILTVEKPVVTTFEGVRGLKEIYMDTLRDKQPVYAVLTTATVEPELFKWLTTYYGKARAKAGIHAKVIVSSGTWAEEYERKDEEELRETVQVPHHLFPFKHEVDIYGSKVAFINYKKGDPLVGVVINKADIAKTMKAWFDLAWKGAETISSPAK